MQSIILTLFLELLYQLGDDLIQIPYEPNVRNLENWGVRILKIEISR